MNLTIKHTTLKGFLNKSLRIPQRQNGIILSTGVAAVITVFKNKQIIKVFSEVKSPFNSKI